MIKAILLDLDNTLLINPDKDFARAFLEGVTSHFQHHHGVDDGAHIHRASLKRLGDLHDSTQTNAARMMAYFQRESGLSADETRTAWEQFYAEIYPSLLETCIAPVPRAADLIHNLRAAGFTLAIATNPIYPEAAILARMAQAGLPTEAGTYALITGAEVMHHAKSDPAYYAEVIARIGVEPDEALMVGDSLPNDIRPAQALGLHTFRIMAESFDAPEIGLNGTLDEFALLIRDSQWLQRFPTEPLRMGMIEPQYRGNIGALFGLLETVQPDYWDKHPIPNEWSILQILCHLVETENEHQRPELERILREDNPFIVAPHPSGPDLPVCNPDGYEIARQFVQARQQTLDFLAQVHPSAWERPARHSIFGLTTLLEMSYFIARHDRLHLNQLCQTIGRCVSFS